MPPRRLAVWDKDVLYALDRLQRENASQTWFTCSQIKNYMYVPYCMLAARCLNKFVNEGIIVRSWSISAGNNYTFNRSRIVVNLRHNVELYTNSVSAVAHARIQHAYNKVILAFQGFVASPENSVETVYSNRLIERAKRGNF